MSGPVLVRRDQGVVFISFNRPEKLNAINVAIAEGFLEAVREAIAAPEARVVVLYGEGRAFVAGGDLADFHQAGPNAPEVARRVIGPMHEAIALLSESRLVSVAALHGAVAGGGMSVALSADLAVAADTAKFNMAYLNVAASPDCSGTWHLVRLVGLRKAMEIALLSKTLDAREALDLGLINQVTSADALMETVSALAHRLAQGPLQALARTKALLRAAGTADLRTQLDAEGDSFAASAGTPDFREALSAFFDKRPPKFS